jgi:hypothetical protein
MPNRHRGEIEAELGGACRRLVLTLGALAELESAFGADDLVDLAERFSGGRLRARDLVCLVGAGLRGAGESVTDQEVAAMTTPGGAAGFVRIAADLLAATFGTAEPPDRGSGPGGDLSGGRPSENPFAPQDGRAA